MTPEDERQLQEAEKRIAARRAEMGIGAPTRTPESGAATAPPERLQDKSGSVGAVLNARETDPLPQTVPGTDSEETTTDTSKYAESIDTGSAPDPTGDAAHQHSASNAPEPPEPGVEWWVEGLGPDERPEVGTERSLNDFVLDAARRNHQAFQNIRVAANVERVTGDPNLYRSPTRVLVGLLKGRQEFAQDDEIDAANRLEGELAKIFPSLEDPWMGKWKGGEAFIPAHDSFGNVLDAREDFIYNWSQWQDDATPMVLDGVGRRRAEDFAERYPVHAARHRSVKDRPYLRVVSLCYWLARLQKHINDQPWFFLSVRDAGTFAGCSHPTAGKLLARAQRDGLLELRNGDGRKGRKAQEFSFCLEKVALAG